MSDSIKVIYRNGTFILETACDLPEGSEVELLIPSGSVVSHTIYELHSKQPQILTSLFIFLST